MLYGQEFTCSQLKATYATILEVDDQSCESTYQDILPQAASQAWLPCAEELADSLLESRQFEQFEQFLTRLITIAQLQQNPESSDLWSLHYRMSRYYFYTHNDITLAHKHTNLALTEVLSAKSASKTQLLKTYYLASSVVREYGEVDYAQEFLVHAAELVTEIYGHDSYQFGVIQNSIGNLYYTQGKYEQAVLPYRRARKILILPAYKQLAYVKSTQNLATSLVNIGQVKEAEQLYEEVIQYLIKNPEEDSPILREIYGNLGILYKQTQQHELSRTFLLRSMDMAKKTEQDTQAEIATLELEMSHLELSLGNHFSALIWAHQACSRLDSALDIHQIQAFADVNHIAYQDLPILLNACQLKGAALLKRYQENPQRLDDLKHSLGFFEQMGPIYRRIRQELPRQEDQLLLPLSLDNQQPYISMALTCVNMLYAATGQESYLASAFRLMEHNRGMIGFEQMRARKQVHLGNLPPDAFAYGDSLLQAIQRQQAIIKEASFTANKETRPLLNLQQRYRHWQDTLRISSTTRRALLLGYRVSEVADLQKALSKSDAIWISYHFSENAGGYILAIDRHQVHLIPFDVSKDFQTQLKQWRTQLSNPDMSREAWDQLIYSGSALYRQLILPVHTRIQLEERPLIIVPDGPLQGISFAPMLSEIVDEMPGNFRELPYLARKHAISYAQSATALLAQQQLYDPMPSYSCLGMAYSSPSSSHAETRAYSAKKVEIPLLGTAQEIQNLQSLISGKYFWGHKATESAFRLHCRQANLLHLAVHGIGDTTEPYLIFQQDAEQRSSTDDGHLYMKELSTLSLQAHMAVLSACETGQGDLHQREGMLSMARAFLAAGSASVMMNYWRAHDQASVSLMHAYYQALVQHKSKAQALQASQLLYLENHNNLQSHPAYWSGLVIWGNPDALWQPSSLPWSIGLSVLFSMLAFLIGYMRAKRRV